MRGRRRVTPPSTPATGSTPANDVDELLADLVEAVHESASDRPETRAARSVTPTRARTAEEPVGRPLELAAAIILGLIAIAVGIAIGILSARLLG